MMSKDTKRTILLAVSTSAVTLLLILLIRSYGIESAIDVAPTVIFLGIWLPLMSLIQTKNHENELKRYMDSNSADELADVEFKRSFFLEAFVIQMVYALIFYFKFNSLLLEWILLGIIGSLSLAGYVFSNRSHRLLAPIFAIPLCSVMIGEAIFVLEGNKDDIISLVKFSMGGFIVTDAYYFGIKYAKKDNTITKH